MQVVMTKDLILKVMENHLMTPVSGDPGVMGVWSCTCGKKVFVQVGQFSYFPLACRKHIAEEIMVAEALECLIRENKR